MIADIVQQKKGPIRRQGQLLSPQENSELLVHPHWEPCCDLCQLFDGNRMGVTEGLIIE